MTNSNDSVKLGAKLLLEGAKMLNTPCPICRSPIYQLRDQKLYCTTCVKEVVRENASEPNIMDTNQVSADISKDPIAAKIAQLSSMLDKENDPAKIVEIADTIKKLQQIQNNKG